MDYPIRFVDQLRQHLRGLRKRRGLTQAELGHRLGLGQARIAEIEKDPGAVSTDQIVRLLAVLGTTVVLRDEHDDSAVKPPSSRRTALKGTDKPVSASANDLHKKAREHKARAASDARTGKRGPETAPTQKINIRPNKGSW
jgi:HTH-type transcriptional regulator/antitoxin HipB